VVDQLKEDATVGATKLQRRLKDEYKVLIPYRRVCVRSKWLEGGE
jgi:hypothetical protein